ncbi:replication-associated protein [Odonata-associated circular virus-9]|uniref:replication-associated protein n=1 Tax=Odonata-associated circular virus-9 TaxID=1592129 RepID=UPI0005863C67|nr:replication-associated protein [Odonata-associated circular virus-9]AJD07474.1 replication-associated protein [Odonata-associated circular virus-9]
MIFKKKIYFSNKIKMSSRNYVLTIYDFNLLPKLQDSAIRYSAYTDEICPTTGRPHKQAYIVLYKKQRPSFVRKLFPNTYNHIMNGTLEQNDIYISKKNTQQIHEYGDKPMTQEEKGEEGAAYWREQLELAKKDPSLCDPKLQIIHHRNLEAIHEKAKRVKLSDLDKLDNWWYIGCTGTGKSRTARQLYPDAYIKQCNKWWNDYDGEETVIIDDLNPDHKFMANFIDQWCDHYPFPAEFKGGQKTIRPKRFIITTRYTIEEILGENNFSQIESWKRRFQIKEF